MCTFGSLVIALLGKYWGDDLEEKEMGTVCTACEREGKCTEGGSEETGRN